MKTWRWIRRRERLAVAGAFAVTVLAGGGAHAAAVRHDGDAATPPPEAVATAHAGDGAVRPALASHILYLETLVNGVATGLVLPYRVVGGRVHGERVDLQQLGLHIEDDWVDAEGRVELSRIPGLVYRLDALRQALEITVGAEHLEPHHYDAARTPAQPTVWPGFVVNYDAYAQQAEVGSGEAADTLSGLLDFRAFGNAGTFVQTALFRSADPAPDAFERSLRLDSVFMRSDPERMRTFRAGDVISGASLTWATPVRLGGVQLQRNFQLQPGLVTFPLPTVEGLAAVPSTVDVFVNSVRQYSGAVAPGPFTVGNVPVITGHGEIEVVVRDALGRERVTTLPFYAAANLLRPGWADYSLEAGFVRRNYATESDDYDDRPAALGSVRAGVTDWLTLEAHGEGVEGLVNGGIGGVVRLGLYGVATASVSGSRTGDVNGAEWSAGYQWFGRTLGVSVATRSGSSGYRALAGLETGALPTRRTTTASVSRAIGAGGLSLGYVEVEGPGVLADPGPAAVNRIGTLSYSLAFRGQWSLSAALFRDFAEAGRDGATLGLTRFFGGRTTASLNAQVRGSDTAGTLQVGQSLPAEGTGAGWHVHAASDAAGTRGASAGYRFDAVTAEAGFARDDTADVSFGSLRGAVVGMELGAWPMLANPIRDSFALVDTGVPNVTVLHENRPIGRSNDAGLLLVPSLAAHASNQIAIDPRDVPPDVEINAVSSVAVPLDRSGVFVKFPVRRTQAATVTLHTEDGTPVPVGARVTVDGGATGYLVGYDGQAYVRELGGHATLIAEWDGGRCQTELEYRPQPGMLQQVGPLPCRTVAP